MNIIIEELNKNNIYIKTNFFLISINLDDAGTLAAVILEKVNAIRLKNAIHEALKHD